MASRLKEYYIKSVVPALMEKFRYQNTTQVPVLKKIVVNMGLGEAIQNPKIMDSAQQEIAIITGNGLWCGRRGNQ
jgi:large subunit ribosomal protein L5